jgi:hypothetical protein
MDTEFAQLEARSDIWCVALDLEYLRDRNGTNRGFAYVVTYDTFIAPPRDPSGAPTREPELRSVVKLGDGGQEGGRSAGSASGSIISRIVRSYWDEPNAYGAVLQGVVIPGNDRNISRKVSRAVGGWELRVIGDVWDITLLHRLSVGDLLKLMGTGPPTSSMRRKV